MDYLILGTLPYVTIVVFLLGMGYRFFVWIKTPQPAAITLFPAPHGGPATFLSVVRESFLFPGLFRGDRFFWGLAWVFHFTLALIFIGHIRVFTDFPKLWAALGIDADRMSAGIGGAAGMIVGVFALLLFLRRLAVLRVREISQFSDFFALVLVLAILLTGNALRFGGHFDLSLTRAYFADLFTFTAGASSRPDNPMFTLHVLLAQILIMVIPYSKILHFGGIFFTQAVIHKS